MTNKYIEEEVSNNFEELLQISKRIVKAVNYTGAEDHEDVVSILKQTLKDCQKQTRQEIVGVIKKDKDFLTRTILLNWLRSWTDLYGKDKERDFQRVLKEFIINKIKNFK